MIGKTISHYRVVGKLGEGGMGVVYKAEDTKLHRTVALKFLRSDSVEDEELTTRFRHEAEAAASLDHSNICTVYEIDEVDGQIFLAMAFVDGPSLKEAIAERPLKMDVALDFALQIAEGLSAAHEAGIVHRDIKPGNILLNRRRQAKILDFGLAHLGAATQITKTGTVIGTPAYMSPEQVRGEKADRRTDIWSLGVVLYEMLTARLPFQGESGQATALSIQNEQPEPPTALRSGIPKELDGIVAKALAKDPASRYQHVEDLLVDLRRLKQESDSGSGQQVLAAPGKRQSGLYIAAAVGVVALMIGLATGWFRESPDVPVVQQSVIPLTTYPGLEVDPAFSPDGNDIAFSWTGPGGDNFDIYRQQVGQGESRLQLTDDPANDISPVWSPNGKSVAFLRALGNGRMAVIQKPSIGGTERILANVASFGTFDRAIDWSPHGDSLAIVDRASREEPGAIYLLSLETREKKRLTNPPKFSDADVSPAFSSDGQALVFIRRYQRYGTGRLYLLRLDSDRNPRGEPIRLAAEFLDVGSPTWSPDGQSILFAAEDRRPRQLWKVPVSGRGEPMRVASGQGSQSFAISRQGDRLVWVRPEVDTNIWHLTLPEAGDQPEAPQLFFSSTRRDAFPRYSPDGTRIATQSNRSGVDEIWTCDPNGENPERVTNFDRGWAGSPRWSPDGLHIAFDSTIDGKWDVYTVRATGGQPTRITDHPANNIAPSWSQDGEWLYFDSNRDGIQNVWKKRIASRETVQVTEKGGYRPSESIDGKWAYYMKSDSGGAGLWRVPSAGGEEEKLLADVEGPGFTVLEDGIYYMSTPDPGGSSSVQFYRFSDERSHTVARIGGLAGQVNFDCEVSPDRKTVLYRRTDRNEADLMLVDNFR